MSRSLSKLTASLNTLGLSTREFNIRFQYAMSMDVFKWSPVIEEEFLKYKEEKEKHEG